MSTQFQFATVEFLPFPDLGEFVIVGVVAVSIDRVVSSKLLPSTRTKRLTDFFPEIDRSVFQETLKELKQLLQNLHYSVNFTSEGRETTNPWLDESDSTALFNTLTSSREGMVRIRKRGVANAPDLERWIASAFDRFALRTSCRIPDSAEQSFTDHFKKLLTSWRLGEYYQRAEIGSKNYHATFPFAYTPMGMEIPKRAIKPLHLGQSSPTKIIDHGDAWLQKVRRLRQFDHAPSEIIFPVDLPDGGSPESEVRIEAADSLVSEFRSDGIRVVKSEDLSVLRKDLEAGVDMEPDLFR